MAHQYVFGLLAPRCSGNARTVWNALLRDHGIDGFFDFYSVRSRTDLELRLSEMFHLGRAAYIVSPEFAQAILPLLDELDASVSPKKGVDMVINESGILRGYARGEADDEACLRLWTQRFKPLFSD